MISLPLYDSIVTPMSVLGSASRDRPQPPPLETGWWPVMSAVAWPLGYMVGGSLGALVGQSLNVPFIGGMIGSILIGTIIGTITGAVLLWMLRENRAMLDDLEKQRAEAKA